MDAQNYQASIASVTSGKILPGAIYLHSSAIDQLPVELAALIQNVASALKLDIQWNIVKLHKDAFKISYLLYRQFDEDPYPSLQRAAIIDLVSKRMEQRDYLNHSNPPILHRKELLVKPDYPFYEEFSLITQEGELAGLYDNTSVIGHKQSWEFLIRQRGYELVDGRLFRSAAVQDDQTISREKTAITRFQLSAPFQSIAKLGYLDGQYTVLDYGCGRGDDMAILESQQIDVIGWDPNYRPDGECAPRDIVNLGYVINVIEDRHERDEALLRAYQNAEKLLLVSAMLASESQIAKFTPYKDGVITSRNTFQKYYTQQELREYIEDILQTNPITLAGGLFAVFKDPAFEHSFLDNRYRRRPTWTAVRRIRKTKEEKLRELIEANQELFDQYWLLTLQAGRFPKKGEFNRDDEILSLLPSRSKLHGALLAYYDEDALKASERATKEDLILVHAMSLFSGRRIFKHLPESLKQEIRHFFGNFKELQNESYQLLHNLADTSALQAAVDEVVTEPIPAFYEEARSLTIHKSQLDHLPVILRAYVGSAQQLYGDLEPIDLIKLHIHTGKVSFLGYDGFADQPIAHLRERIKVDLWKLQVDYFDYGEEFKPRPLYWKSMFIDESFECYKKQKSFDEKLDLYGLAPENPSFGMPEEELSARLKRDGLEVRGFRFYNLEKTNE